MLKILQSKGYPDGDDVNEIVNWLLCKGFYVDILGKFDDDGKFLGNYAIAQSLKSNSHFVTYVYKTKHDALEVLIYSLKDYL